ncbi:hypothetical protein QZH41_018613 [Actinostola sp. cb2023]|nr:hypothetical protein QZH41_018613 [Actinostola sp. cb2023]
MTLKQRFCHIPCIIERMTLCSELIAVGLASILRSNSDSNNNSINKTTLNSNNCRNSSSSSSKNSSSNINSSNNNSSSNNNNSSSNNNNSSNINNSNNNSSNNNNNSSNINNSSNNNSSSNSSNNSNNNNSSSNSSNNNSSSNNSDSNNSSNNSSRRMGEKGRVMCEFFRILNDIMMKIVNIIMWYAPIGICSLIATRVADMEDIPAAVSMLAMFIVTVLTGLLIHAVIVLPLIFFIVTRKNPYRFIAGMRDALVTAFGISSSSATLPTTIRCLEENNKVDERISKFVLPLGATVNMDGGALYEAISAIFIAQLSNIALSPAMFVATCLPSVILHHRDPTMRKWTPLYSLNTEQMEKEYNDV